MCIKIYKNFKNIINIVPIIAHYQNHFILIFHGTNVGKIILNIGNKCFTEFTLIYILCIIKIPILFSLQQNIIFCA